MSMNQRPIEFRAWNKNGKFMFFPDYIGLNDRNAKSDGIVIADYELMQFTGLLDKNGKKIFEGDILDWGNWENGEGERCEVDYYSERGSFSVNYFSKWGGEGYDLMPQFLEHRKDQPFEIIGSIYENSELVE